MKKIWRFFKNHIISIIITIVFGFIFYYLQIESTEISYSVSSTDIISQSNTNSKIRVYYDSTLCNNVKSVKIAFWNSGTEFIDKKNISTTNPIIIEPSEGIDILEVNIRKKNRESLNVFPIIYYDSIKNKEIIKINIKGDDGFEKKEGVIFSILYSSKNKNKWNLKGRIKGSPKPFNKLGWDRVLTIQDFIWGGLLGLLFLLGLIIFAIIRYEPIIEKKKLKYGDYIYIIIFSILGLLLLKVIIENTIDYFDFRDLIDLFS